MPEVPHTGEDHRNAMLVGGFYYLFVADTTPRLDDGGDARFGGGVYPVTEREEGIGSQHCAVCRQQSFLDSDL